MSKLRGALMLIVFSLITFSPLLVSAAEPASFFGPIVSEECKCPGSAPGWGCILQTMQNLMNLGISLSVIVATIIIAYAGFLFIVSAANVENRKKGKDLLLNAVIGMVIVLSAWLVIDFVMKALYDSDSFGPWNQILTGQTDAGYCLVSKTGNQNLIDNSNGTVTTCVDTTTPNSTTTSTGGNWSFDSGISAQMSHASPELASLLSCMRAKLPRGVGRISSISDSAITSGSKTFAQCAAGGKSVGCHHSANACHFGGNPSKGKVGQSYAVDFGDQQNALALRKAAAQCNSDARYYFEGDHVHISLGHLVNAGCDMTMALAGTGGTSTTGTGSTQTCTTTTTSTTGGVTTGTTNTTPTTPATSTPTVDTAVTTTFTVSPTTVTSGGKSTLTWNSTNATSCVGTGFSTGNAKSGTVSVSPTVTTDYSVTCTGAAGNKKASARVTVSPTPSKPAWDPAAAAAFLVNQAETLQTEGYKCALYVRRAIAAGGLTWFNNNHPQYANQYGTGFLESAGAGFKKVASGITTLELVNFDAKQGDVIVFQPICGNSDSAADKECRSIQTGSSPVPTAPNMLMNHPHGHIAMFDGASWTSLWVQDDPWSFGDYVQCSGGECRPETGTNYSRPGVRYDIFRHP